MAQEHNPPRDAIAGELQMIEEDLRSLQDRKYHLGRLLSAYPLSEADTFALRQFVLHPAFRKISRGENGRHGEHLWEVELEGASGFGYTAADAVAACLHGFGKGL